MKEAESLNQAFKKAQIISIAISSSVFIYGAIAYFVSKNLESTGSNNHTVFRFVFITSAMSLLIAVKIVQKYILAKGANRSSEEGLISSLLNATIIGMAMCESIALLGMVLCLVTREMNDYFLFGFASLAGIMYYFPKIHVWESRLDQNRTV